MLQTVKALPDTIARKGEGAAAMWGPDGGDLFEQACIMIHTFTIMPMYSCHACVLPSSNVIAACTHTITDAPLHKHGFTRNMFQSKFLPDTCFRPKGIVFQKTDLIYDKFEINPFA